MSLILAIDQGTTSSRVILYRDMDPIFVSQHEFEQIYPKSGFVEHDPFAIIDSQFLCIKEAFEFIGDETIDAIGITNQRESVIVWDKTTGKPIYNAIVWQCRRTADYCEELTKKGLGVFIHSKTGLPIDPYFSASKIRWILKNVDGARELAQEGRLIFGTVDTWLIWNMTNGKVHATDVSNASRTQLFNINTLDWDDELLDLFEIPRAMLPKVLDSSDDYGVCEMFGREIPIYGVAGDQQAALFGQSCFGVGDCKNTYGTGAFLLANVGEKPILRDNGLITTVAWRLDGKTIYALEGSVFCAGSVIQWLRDGLGIIGSSQESETLARSVEDAGGVFIVPAFTGLGAPFWDSEARGLICGLTRGTSRAHIARAAIESIAFQVNELIELIRSSGIVLGKLCVDGGAAQNSLLLQFQSDVSNITLLRKSSIEATARGAALFALYRLANGKLPSEEIEEFAVFEPKMSSDERKTVVEGWREAAKRALVKKSVNIL